MKKYLLAIGLTLIAAPALAADELNCANIPDTECADLGFVQTTTNCSGFPSLKCPFDSTQVYCGDVCYVGAILYSDGKCYERTQTNKEVVGVVFDMENRLAVSLNIKEIKWSSGGTISGLTECYDGFISCDTNGKSNTAAIVAQLGNTSDYAAGYCYNLTEGGKTAGSWWLPSAKELNIFRLSKRTAVNSGLTAAGGEKYKPEEVVDNSGYSYWSSGESFYDKTWALNPYDSGWRDSSKNKVMYARCITSF